MRDAGEFSARKRRSNLGAGIRGGIDFCNTQGDGAGLLVDSDMFAAVLCGEGYSVASRDITCRGFGFDQVICRIGQKRCLCTPVFVHLDSADTCIARTFKDIEGCATESVGVVAGGDVSLGRLFLERYGDGGQNIEHVLVSTLARDRAVITPGSMWGCLNRSGLSALVEPTCSRYGLGVFVKPTAPGNSLAICIRIGAVGARGSVEHPHGNLGGGTGEIGRQIVAAKGCTGGVSVTDDGGKFVIEPCPALAICAPWPSRLAGAGAVLIHAVRNRSVLCLVFTDAEGAATVAYGAEIKGVTPVDGECGSWCQAADQKKEEQEQRTCCDCAVDRVRGCVGHGCSLSLVRRTGRPRRLG